MAAVSHILVFSLAYDPYVGGAEIALREITKRLPHYSFTIITARALKNFPYISLPDTQTHGNVRIVRVGSKNRFIGQYGYPLAALKRAYLETRFQKSECVWGMLESYGGIAAYLFHRRFQEVPYLLTMQSGDAETFWRLRTWFWKPYYKKVFTEANAIQAISRYLADRAKIMGARGRIEVVPNGVDFENFSKPPINEERQMLRRQWAVDDDGVAILSTSRLVAKNGIDTLIRGYALWRKQYFGRGQDLPNPSFVRRGHLPLAKGEIERGSSSLVILGKGPLKLKLKELARREGIGAEVKFIGEVPNAELPRYYHSSDIFVRPSRSEGLGNSFLEAMAAGIPVIGTSVGGIREFLTHEVTGLMIQPDSPQEIAQAFERLTSDKELREVVTANAKKVIVEKYTWDSVAERMGTLFEQLLKESKSK